MKEKLEYRLIPSEEKVWSIALQKNVIFEEDIIVKITNRVIGDDDYVYGTIQILLFNIPGHIPTLLDQANGDIGFSIGKTKKWKLPNPVFKNFKYEK